MTFGTTYYTSREEWLADVAPHTLGGTAAADVLVRGRGWDVWSKAQAGNLGCHEPVEPNPYMARGIRWEPIVATEYEKITGRQVLRPLCRVSNSETPWLRVSPDGFVWVGGRLVGGLEVKTVSSWSKWGEDGLVACPVLTEENPLAKVAPIDYQIQVICCLHATQLPWWDIAACAMDFASWEPEIRIIRILRSETLESRVVSELRDWRERYLLGGQAPPVDGSDACMRHLCAPEATERRAATAVEESLMTEYRLCTQNADQAEADRGLARNWLMEAMGQAKAIYGRNLHATRCRVSPRPSLAASRIKESAPDLWAELQRRELVTESKPGEYLRVEENQERS